jgi:hypothetical protein
MATGLLGQAALAAATNTTLYTVPATTFTVLGISLCNRGTTTVSVRVALATAGTPTTSEWIEYDAQIGPNGVLERTGIMMNATKQLVVYASNANVSASAFGIETSTV